MIENQEYRIEAIDKVFLAETKALTLYSLTGDILFCRYHDNINIELDDIKEAFDLYLEHSNNCTFKVLLEFGQYSTIDVEARKYAEDVSMPTPAQAMVIKSLAHRMIARFYQLLRKDKHPLKIVKTADEGLNWLKSIKTNGSSQSNSDEYMHN